MARVDTIRINCRKKLHRQMWSSLTGRDTPVQGGSMRKLGTYSSVPVWPQKAPRNPEQISPSSWKIILTIVPLYSLVHREAFRHTRTEILTIASEINASVIRKIKKDMLSLMI